MFVPPGFNRPALNSEENEIFRCQEQYLATPVENLSTRTLASGILSRNEIALQGVLKRRYAGYVFPQVQLIRVVEVDMATLQKQWQDFGSAWWERPGKSDTFMQISMLSLDYILCDGRYQVKFVIELDGPEHDYDANVLEASIKLRKLEYKTLTGIDKANVDRARLWSRDRIKEAAVKGAGLRFIRIKNDELLDRAALEARLVDEGVFRPA
jgi:very-short-patch-repair endonuclease